MRRKNARKGFTIVELVIVIAVIAILATTLVPTFGNVIQNAQETAAKQEAKNAYTSYMVANAGKGEMPELFLYKAEEGRVVAIRNGAAVGIYATPEEALTALIGEDYDMNELQPTADGKFFAYGGEVPTASNPTEPPIQPEEPPVELTDWSGASAVFVGDSITYASGIANPYHKLVEAELGLLNSPHMGIAGSCISATSNYNHTYTPLIDRYQNIPAVELIVIFMGTNDFGHNTPLGTDQDTTDISFYGALNMIIPGVKAAHPNSQIVVMTPLHRGAFNGQPVDSAQNGAGCTLADYVGAIKDVCADNEIPVIDLFNLCALNPTDKIYFSDNLHPTAKGHEELAKIIAEELKKIPRPEDFDNSGEDEGNDEKMDNPTMVQGNKFGAGFENNTNRMTAAKNVYLTKGTIVALKNPATYMWAITPQNLADTWEQGQGYAPNPTAGYTNAAGDCYYIIPEDGYYGFTLRRVDNTAFTDADPSNLLDYIDYVTMVTGNKFGSGYENNTKRITASRNVYLTKGTVVTLKDPSTYMWAITPQDSGDAWQQNRGYYPANGYKNDPVYCYYIIPADGYYGFTFRKVVEADFNSEELSGLLDYIDIPVMDNGNIYAGGTNYDVNDKTKYHFTVNLYLSAGTKIKFSDAESESWGYYLAQNATPTEKDGQLQTGSWIQNTEWTVKASGYCGFVVKKNAGFAKAPEQYTFSDFFEIITP